MSKFVPMPRSIRCMWMRGGTSKAAYFLEQDLPADRAQRDQFLLRIMGSPDELQIDGMGGANPKTSQVAVVKKSSHYGIDVDYLFLQVELEKSVVTTPENCGEILAGVGPFAIERGLVTAHEGETSVAINIENTNQVATQKVITRTGKVIYDGNAKIDKVPRTASPISITFNELKNSGSGALLPTGNQVDIIDNIAVTVLDIGIPLIVLLAEDLGISINSNQDIAEIEQINSKLTSIDSQVNTLRNIADAADNQKAQVILISKAIRGGAVTAHAYSPNNQQQTPFVSIGSERSVGSVGLIGAIGAAIACILPNGPIYKMANLADNVEVCETLIIEHADGSLKVVLGFDRGGNVDSATIVRTARKLFDGQIFA